MQRVAVLLLILVLAPACGPWRAAAQDAPTITWPYFHFPPFSVVQAGRHSGAWAEVNRLLAAGLAEYGHRRVYSPVSRSLLDASRGRLYCFTGLLRSPEREELLAYSLPMRLAPPLVLAVRTADKASHVRHGRVSLAELLARPGASVAVAKGFHYADMEPILDSAEAEDPAKVLRLSSEQATLRQFELLRAGRVDAAIVTAPQGMYELAGGGADGGAADLAFLPLAEAREYLVGHVACTRAAGGEAVVERINGILAEAVVEPGFINLYLPWIPPGLREEFRSRFTSQVVEPARRYRGE
mgnify:CR=1 FL=1